MPATGPSLPSPASGEGCGADRATPKRGGSGPIFDRHALGRDDLDCDLAVAGIGKRVPLCLCRDESGLSDQFGGDERPAGGVTALLSLTRCARSGGLRR
jgi:hypothetical protein